MRKMGIWRTTPNYLNEIEREREGEAGRSQGFARASHQFVEKAKSKRFFFIDH